MHYVSGIVLHRLFEIMIIGIRVVEGILHHDKQ